MSVAYLTAIPLTNDIPYLVVILYAEYDWKASHFSKVVADVSHDQSLPLDHDDVIIKAMPVLCFLDS